MVNTQKIDNIISNTILSMFKGGAINPEGVYGLHAVIIKKPIDLDEAKRIAKDIIKDNTKTFYRETNQSYRFRNISKQKFIPKSFRTKKIRGRPISLVFGELLPQYEHLKGEGLMDFFGSVKKKATEAYSKVKDFFSPTLDDYSNTSKDTLQRYGNIPVQSLTIYRTPIKGIFNRIINFISLGKWDELKRKYGFDRLFHLALVANIGTKNIIIEKNEVVNVSTSYKTDQDTEVQGIPLSGKIFTVKEMLETARRQVGDHTFFDYDAFTNNCQYFIKYLLEGMGLYTEQAKSFLFQDLKEIYEELPSYVPSIIKGVTKTGAVVSKLTGQGEDESDDETGDFFTEALYNYIVDNPKRYENKDISEAFSDFIEDLPEDSDEYRKIVELYNLEGSGRPKNLELEKEKGALKELNKSCKDKIKKVKEEIVDIREQCKKGKETRKGMVEKIREKIKEKKAIKEAQKYKKNKIELQNIEDIQNDPNVDVDNIQFVLPKKKKPETLEDLFEATKFPNLETYLWATQTLPLYNSIVVYENYYILYLLDKYKEDCLIIGEKEKVDLKGKRRGVTHYGDLTGWRYSNDYTGAEGKTPEPKLFLPLPADKYFEEMAKCRTGGARFVAIPVTLGLEKIEGSKVYTKKYFHGNLILVDLKTNTAEYYEPHGEYTGTGNPLLSNYIFDLQFILQDLFNKNGYDYLTPVMTCPRITENNINNNFRGLQGISSEGQGFFKDKEGGYCGLWVILYLNLRLQYPDLSGAELNEAVLEIFKYHPDTVANFMRSYTDNISKWFIDKVMKRVFSGEKLENYIKLIYKKRDVGWENLSEEDYDLHHEMSGLLEADYLKVAGSKNIFKDKPVDLLEGIKREDIERPKSLEEQLKEADTSIFLDFEKIYSPLSRYLDENQASGYTKTAFFEIIDNIEEDTKDYLLIFKNFAPNEKYEELKEIVDKPIKYFKKEYKGSKKLDKKEIEDTKLKLILALFDFQKTLSIDTLYNIFKVIKAKEGSPKPIITVIEPIKKKDFKGILPKGLKKDTNGCIILDEPVFTELYKEVYEGFKKVFSDYEPRQLTKIREKLATKMYPPLKYKQLSAEQQSEVDDKSWTEYKITKKELFKEVKESKLSDFTKIVDYLIDDNPNYDTKTPLANNPTLIFRDITKLLKDFSPNLYYTWRMRNYLEQGLNAIPILADGLKVKCLA